MKPNSYEMLSSTRLDATFAALADPTRRAILARLASGEASVKDLAKPFNMSQPAVSKHLKVLERAGLVSSVHDAQRRPRRVSFAPLDEVAQWIEAYKKKLEGNFQRLDALLEELQAVPREAKPAAARKPSRKRTRHE